MAVPCKSVVLIYKKAKINYDDDINKTFRLHFHIYFTKTLTHAFKSHSFSLQAALLIRLKHYSTSQQMSPHVCAGAENGK